MRCSLCCSLKDKTGTIIVNAFQNILNDPERKPRKIWVDQGGEFYKNSLKKWLKDNVMGRKIQ